MIIFYILPPAVKVEGDTAFGGDNILFTQLTNALSSATTMSTMFDPKNAEHPIELGLLVPSVLPGRVIPSLSFQNFVHMAMNGMGKSGVCHLRPRAACGSQ